MHAAGSLSERTALRTAFLAIVHSLRLEPVSPEDCEAAYRAGQRLEPTIAELCPACGADRQSEVQSEVPFESEKPVNGG